MRHATRSWLPSGFPERPSRFLDHKFFTHIFSQRAEPALDPSLRMRDIILVTAAVARPASTIPTPSWLAYPDALHAYFQQVASHAQKYFIRLNSMNKKDKRRASIHDITSPTLPASVANPAPTTGLAPAAASGKATSSLVQGATSSATTATSQPMAAAAAAAAAAFPAAAHVAAAAAAAAAAATSTTSVFAQLAMHGLAMQPVMQQAAAAAAAAGMMPQLNAAAAAAAAAGMPAPVLPNAAQYMVQV